MTRIVTLAGVLCLVVVAGASQPQDHDPRIVVGPTVHVSGNRPTEDFYEVQVAADPTDPQHLLGCTMLLTNAKSGYNAAIYASRDGGETWAMTYELDSSHYTADPTCVLGRGGSAYAAFLGTPRGSRPGEMYFLRSRDRGLSWGAPDVMPLIDREYITIDTTGGKYDGRVYLHGLYGIRGIDNPTSSVSTLRLFAAAGARASFSNPVDVRSSADRRISPMGNAVVMSDGTLAVAFGELVTLARRTEARPRQPNAALKVITSSNGGESFNAAAHVSDWYQIGSQTSRRSMPVMAVDRSVGPFRDRLYVVWDDVRSGRREIMLAYSADRGTTWSSPMVVSDDTRWPETIDAQSGPDNSMAQVAVDGQGRVGVSWYDRRDNRHDSGWRVRFAASLDGGETFSPSVAVSPESNRAGLAPTLNLEAMLLGGRHPDAYAPGGPLRLELGPGDFYFEGGDTGGLTVDAADRFHPFWVDNRTGTFQLYTTAVSVLGDVRRNGSQASAQLSDISALATVTMSEAMYERATQTVSVRARVRNTSTTRISGPIKFRVLAVNSPAGPVTIVGADNSRSGPGAVWDFVSTGPTDGIGPGESSQPKTLVFRLINVAGLEQLDAVNPRRWVALRAVLLGPQHASTASR